MEHKFLKEIGAGEPILDISDKREKKYREYEEKYGVYPPDCWALDYTMREHLYERLIQYLKDAEGIINLDFHKFTFEEKEYTQKELINKMITIAEFSLMDLEKVSKKTKAYKRLINNPYYIKYGKYNDWKEEHTNLVKKFWEIWSIISPAMWW